MPKKIMITVTVDGGEPKTLAVYEHANAGMEQSAANHFAPWHADPGIPEDVVKQHIVSTAVSGLKHLLPEMLR